MKKYFQRICIFLLLFFLFVGIAIYKNNHNPKNTIDVESLQGIDVVELSPMKYIELPNKTLSDYGFTATGITYNYDKSCYYIGNYGKSLLGDQEIHPSIIGFNPSFESIESELYFDDKSLDIQGISYGANESIWYANDDNIINYSVEDGKIISSFKINGYEKYKANGICVDPQDGSLWILCMYNYLLHYNTDGQLINSYVCDYIGQDHVYIDLNGDIYITVGVDYNGNKNYVLKFNPDFTLETIFRVYESYAIEGLLVNGTKLIVVNDGIYHNAKIKKNYIQVYDLDD